MILIYLSSYDNLCSFFWLWNTETWQPQTLIHYSNNKLLCHCATQVTMYTTTLCCHALICCTLNCLCDTIYKTSTIKRDGHQCPIHNIGAGVNSTNIGAYQFYLRNSQITLCKFISISDTFVLHFTGAKMVANPFLFCSPLTPVHNKTHLQYYCVSAY